MRVTFRNASGYQATQGASVIPRFSVFSSQLWLHLINNLSEIFFFLISPCWVFEINFLLPLINNCIFFMRVRASGPKPGRYMCVRRPRIRLYKNHICQLSCIVKQLEAPRHLQLNASRISFGSVVDCGKKKIYHHNRNEKHCFANECWDADRE